MDRLTYLVVNWAVLITSPLWIFPALVFSAARTMDGRRILCGKQIIF
jgi:hypothetical protein